MFFTEVHIERCRLIVFDGGKVFLQGETKKEAMT